MVNADSGIYHITGHILNPLEFHRLTYTHLIIKTPEVGPDSVHIREVSNIFVKLKKKVQLIIIPDQKDIS